jgi:uncharacterized protein YjbI with pentapeptide repeats
MAEQTRPWWPTCELAGCIGIRLASAPVCLTHASEEEAAAALKLVGETATIDARGVLITSALLERILTAAPHGENGRPLIKGSLFQGATFSDEAQFWGVTFSGDAWFNEATFGGNADFERATFGGDAYFYNATFSNSAGFDQVTFGGEASFNKTSFSSGPTFFNTTVGGRAKFYKATFNEAGFLDTTFGGDVFFGGATFSGETGFDGATFSGKADFNGATFRGEAVFPGARFDQARKFGPLVACSGLVLDDVQFAQPIQIEVSSTSLRCRRARFLGGVQFRLRWACVVLDDADLAAQSILAGIPHLSNEELAGQEEPIARTWRRLLQDEISERPQLVSLQGADVAGLGLSNISAADCRFAGAFNLDKLRLESGVSFATAPLPVGLGGRRRGGREVIAEERAWRAERSRRFHRRWVAPRWPRWLDDQKPGVLDPGEIAGLYRALRKGREDVKDEPGAADFYYGEMEMRRARPLSGGKPSRHYGVTSRGGVERSILTAYWLVSGYGLRAWRAVAGLAAVTALFAVAFHLVGFAVPPRPVSYWTSLLYAFRATLSLTDDKVTLTAWGQLLQAVLRLTGPVLLGLALLALRGRVKR